MKYSASYSGKHLKAHTSGMTGGLFKRHRIGRAAGIGGALVIGAAAARAVRYLR
jgi:hypothetical protein